MDLWESLVCGGRHRLLRGDPASCEEGRRHIGGTAGNRDLIYCVDRSGVYNDKRRG